MSKIIDGRQLAAQVVDDVATEAQFFYEQHGVKPGLAVVLVGDDSASQVYVRNKIKRAQEAGLNSIEHKLPTDTDQATLDNLVSQLNEDPAVHGILVQLPLPDHLNEEAIINAIVP